MRGYGLPRNDDIQHPDLYDLKVYGLKAGKAHPKWTANGDNKRRARRVWKKKERAKVKQRLRRYYDQRYYGT